MATERQKQGLSLVPDVVSNNRLSRPPAITPALPAGLEMERRWRTGRMEATRMLGERAISEVSEIHSYAAWKASGTLQSAMLLRQVAEQSGWLTTEMERTLAQMALTYLKTTHAITGAVSEELLETVRELSERSQTPGLWDTVALWLETH